MGQLPGQFPFRPISGLKGLKVALRLLKVHNQGCSSAVFSPWPSELVFGRSPFSLKCKSLAQGTNVLRVPWQPLSSVSWTGSSGISLWSPAQLVWMFSAYSIYCETVNSWQGQTSLPSPVCQQKGIQGVEFLKQSLGPAHPNCFWCFEGNGKQDVWGSHL